MVAEHGKVVSRHYEPESEDALRDLLTAAASKKAPTKTKNQELEVG